MIQTSNINPFDRLSGSSKLLNLKALVVLIGSVIFLGLILAKMKIVGVGLLLALFFGSVYVFLLFKHPIIGLFTAIAFNFTLLGIGRYVTGLPLGFGVDGVFVLTYLALFFNRFKERIDWTPAKKDITILATIWLMYCVFQIVNPEAQSFAAWVSGRGIGFYFFLLIPLALILIDTRKKLDLVSICMGSIFSIGYPKRHDAIIYWRRCS